MLFPEFSDLGPIDQSAVNIVLGFGFIFISGFALLPALFPYATADVAPLRAAAAIAS